MNDKRHSSSVLFVISLYLVFALVAISVVTIGGGVYKKLSAAIDDNFDMRTSLSYVAAKVRGGDAADRLHIDNTLGVPALVIDNAVDTTVYQTWIYFHEGNLYEMPVQQGVFFKPEQGTMLVPLKGFEMSLDQQGGLLLKAVNSQDESCELYLHLRSTVGGESP